MPEGHEKMVVNFLSMLNYTHNAFAKIGSKFFGKLPSGWRIFAIYIVEFRGCTRYNTRGSVYER